MQTHAHAAFMHAPWSTHNAMRREIRRSNAVAAVARIRPDLGQEALSSKHDMKGLRKCGTCVHASFKPLLVQAPRSSCHHGTENIGVSFPTDDVFIITMN